MIEERIEALNGVAGGDDISAIRTKSEELMQASHQILAEAVYQKVQAEQAACSRPATAATARPTRTRSSRRPTTRSSTRRRSGRNGLRGADPPREGRAGSRRARGAPRALERERDEYLSDLKRVAAEFDNFRKRAARDHESSCLPCARAPRQGALPVLDDLERALVAAEEHEEAKLEEGVRLVHRELRSALAKEGLVDIETEGVFDPARAWRRCSRSRPSRTTGRSSR